MDISYNGYMFTQWIRHVCNGYMFIHNGYDMYVMDTYHVTVYEYHI